MTLDDVSCLVHLPIDGMLLSHEAIEMMIHHLGADMGDALKEVTDINGGMLDLAT